MNDTADLTVYRMLKNMDADELRNEAIAYYTEMLELKKKIAEKDAHIDALRRANERLEHCHKASCLDGLKFQFSREGCSWHDGCEAADTCFRVSNEDGRNWSVAIRFDSGTCGAEGKEE